MMTLALRITAIVAVATKTLVIGVAPAPATTSKRTSTFCHFHDGTTTSICCFDSSGWNTPPLSFQQSCRFLRRKRRKGCYYYGGSFEYENDDHQTKNTARRCRISSARSNSLALQATIKDDYVKGERTKILEDDGIDIHKSQGKQTNEHSHLYERRQMLQSTLSALLMTSGIISQKAFALSDNDEVTSATPVTSSPSSSSSSLEDIQFGSGSWVPVSNTTSGTNANAGRTTGSNNAFVPSSFATYASWILIQYDTSVSNWWLTQQNQSRLLSKDEQKMFLSKQFGSLSQSILQSCQIFLHDRLYSSFLSEEDGLADAYGDLLGAFERNYYNNQDERRDDVARHIGILFSLLPSNIQPIKQLKRLTNTISSSSDRDTNMGKSDEGKNNSDMPLSNLVVDGGTSGGLLPPNYSFAFDKDSNSFRIVDTSKKNGNAFVVWEPSSSFESTAAAAAAMVETPFGPLSNKPLRRQKPNLGLSTYAILALSGGFGCALTHGIVIPIDVVKTRIQTSSSSSTTSSAPASTSSDSSTIHETSRSPSTTTTSAAEATSSSATTTTTPKYKGIIDGIRTMYREEGIESLFLGAQATIAGYLWYGLSVYPSYTFFKKVLSEHLDPALAMAQTNNISLVAGALAAVIASIGLTPIEACRIRTVADPDTYRPLGLTGTAALIAGESGSGWNTLYAGFNSLLARQVIFGSVKFLAFERSSEFIFGIWPVLKDDIATSLFVSLVAGAFSGAISSIVSQPADSLLTYIAKSSKSGSQMNLIDGGRQMIQEEGVNSLFRGLQSRCIWAGSIISGQFLLYDLFRSILGVSTEDLSETFQVILTTASTTSQP